jgi:hypothetical protein
VHKHSFSNIVLKLSLDCHHIQLRSCAGPSFSAWISTYPIIPSFWMGSNIFLSTLHARLGPPLSHGSWSSLMHMWSSHRSKRDTFTSLCSWKKVHGHTWCWPDLCKSCLWNCFFPKSGCNNYSSSKSCVISWSTSWGWFHVFNSKDIWIFTLASEWLPSSMCQHGMVNEGL